MKHINTHHDLMPTTYYYHSCRGVGASSSDPATRNIRDSLRASTIFFEYMRGEAVVDDEDVVINSGKVYTISPSSVTCGTPSN